MSLYASDINVALLSYFRANVVHGNSMPHHLAIESTVQIREIRFPEDYPQVQTLWERMDKGVSLGRSDTPEEIQKKLARDPDLFLVAEVEDRIIGTVIGGYDGRRGLLYHLAVEASFRGQGIGSRLMEEIESRLRAKGCLRCYLMVLVDNDEAIRYYENRGWEAMNQHVYTYAKNLA
jgi:ribosomal protein S18 acetylase RimI-like enzyme